MKSSYVYSRAPSRRFRILYRNVLREHLLAKNILVLFGLRFPYQRRQLMYVARGVLWRRIPKSGSQIVIHRKVWKPTSELYHLLGCVPWVTCLAMECIRKVANLALALWSSSRVQSIHMWMWMITINWLIYVLLWFLNSRSWKELDLGTLYTTNLRNWEGPGVFSPGTACTWFLSGYKHCTRVYILCRCYSWVILQKVTVSYLDLLFLSFQYFCL